MKSVRGILFVALLHALSFTGVAAAQWDWPVDHPLTLNDPNVLTRDTIFDSEALRWTGQTRVLAVQPLGGSIDMNLRTNDGTVWISQSPALEDVEFFLLDESELIGGDARPRPECTASVYHNGTEPGAAYAYYVGARDFDAWDGIDGYANIEQWNYEMVAARSIYLKAGFAYRFDIERGDQGQAGFASLMRSDEFTRVQPRSVAVGEFRWSDRGHDDFVIAPEEGWYTLVVVQTNGAAYGLGTVRNTQVFPRGEHDVTNNNIRITVSRE